MTYFVIPSRRTRQPQGAARINFAAEIAQGIRACFTGVDPALELVNNIRFLPSGSPSKSVNQNGLVAVTASNSAAYDGWYAPQQTAGSISDRLYNVSAPPLTLFVVGNSSNQNLGCGIGRCNGSGIPAWSVGFWSGSSKGAHGNCYAGGIDYLFEVQPTAFIETTVGYHTAVLVISPTTTTVYCDGVADQSAATPAGNFEYQYSDKYRCLSVGGGYKFGSGSFALAGMLRSAWSVDLVRAFHRNPWQLFESNRRIYFAPSGGGATIITTSGAASLVARAAVAVAATKTAAVASRATIAGTASTTSIRTNALVAKANSAGTAATATIRTATIAARTAGTGTAATTTLRTGLAAGRLTSNAQTTYAAIIAGAFTAAGRTSARGAAAYTSTHTATAAATATTRGTASATTLRDGIAAARVDARAAVTAAALVSGTVTTSAAAQISVRASISNTTERSAALAAMLALRGANPAAPELPVIVPPSTRSLFPDHARLGLSPVAPAKPRLG